MTRAVVFAYHNVGVKCLSVLLAHRIEVPLVVTHNDNPAENIWFDSVATLAAGHGLQTITPDDPNAAGVVDRVHALQPDFVFSFYYRHMLKPPLLALAQRGALNMHGSLLPKFEKAMFALAASAAAKTATVTIMHIRMRRSMKPAFECNRTKC